ncbi:PRD domain-containing protein [Thermoflavimicrobium daqui]|uniref:Transcription antiterminator BglG n=1 Tax=Thermoflavimicrobium daqui TaxID=2137476 RepID=A0A364K4R2_9BACL|nr:PRD domain-containing protein [Thermoflavimicrobium daqui]RAL24281.1 transcription antiterminator BglG [Thermoflavimicrobium daqui]
MGRNQYEIVRVLNHNVVWVREMSGNEVVLLGKGIGFRQKSGNKIPYHDQRIEKKFRLEDETHVKKYHSLIDHIDQEVIGISEEIIGLISKEFQGEINEHIHVALPEHIQFAMDRLRNGMEITNPFLYLIKALYSKEFSLAKKAAEMISHSFQIEIPESEIGFLALHIHSAISNYPVSKTVQLTSVVYEVIDKIIREMGITIDKSSMGYIRLLMHLRFLIERLRQKRSLSHPFIESIKTNLPEEFQLAREIVTLISNRLNVSVTEAEIGYLAMHLYRLKDE